MKAVLITLIVILAGCSAGDTVPTTVEPSVVLEEIDVTEVPEVTETTEGTEPTEPTEATEAPIVEASTTAQVTIGEIYWSDGDSGRLAGVAFRLRNVDAPETGGVGAAIGGAKCDQEREMGFLAKEFIVTLTSSAAIVITNDYGPDRFNRSVVDLQADGIDVASAGIEAGVLKAWPHDADGNSLAAKPNWCV